MRVFCSIILLAHCVLASATPGAYADGPGNDFGSAHSLTHPDPADKELTDDGFLRRWIILDPIRANGLTDSAVQKAVTTEYFPNQLTAIPRDGDKVTVDGDELTWHAVDTKDYNVNLYHFARALGKPTSNVLFWGVTIVNCPEEVSVARLAIGSNAASVWWVNGREVIGIYGDRQSVIDDGVSKRLTLKKGSNVVRCAVINGGGATDFCARFLDEDNKPLTSLTLSLERASGDSPAVSGHETGKGTVQQPAPAIGEAASPASSSEDRNPDSNFHIYLCFGQSNMEGFPGIEEQDQNPPAGFEVLATVDFRLPERKKGMWYPAVPPLCRDRTGLCPADYFGRTLKEELPENVRVGIVNVSVAGCKIELFDKKEHRDYVASAPRWMKGIIQQYDGNPYAYLVEMGKLAQRDGVIKGILLHQGESNTNDKQWPRKVKAVYDNLIHDLKLNPESVPLLAGEVVNADQNGACASMNEIIATLPREIPNAHVISSAGCECRRDRLHFTANGYRELGRRYGQKMLSMLEHEAKVAK